MPWTEAKLNRRKSQLDQIQTPPDGGWGWVIVFGSIIAGANFAAISRCYSVFYGSLMREYEVDFASVAWMNGAFQAGYGISCPFAATILNRFGFRSVTMAAGIVMTICTASASLAPQLWQVQLLAAFIPGLCMGQIVISLFTAITRYFAHRRNLATQVLCGGFTMGAFVYCPAYQLMIDSYSWRGALLLISGIFFHITAVGALLRPLILSEDFPPELRNRIRRETKSFENFKLSGAFDPNNNKQANLATNVVESENDSGCDVEGLDWIQSPNSENDNDKIWTSESSSDVSGDTFKKRVQKLCKRMELYILTDPRFYYYAFSWVFFAIASSSCLIYLVPYGQSIGLDEMKASSLISALMCGEMVSRCIYGVFMDRTTKTQRFTICASVTLCTSLIFLVLPHLRSYYALMGGCVVLGMSSGGLDGLYSIFIVDLFGLKLYTAAFGYSNIPIHGLGMLSTIMIGKFVDVTGDLTLVFYVGSASAFLSVCVCLKMLQSVRSASQAEEENKISDDHSLL